jgi:hypothetical protein
MSDSVNVEFYDPTAGASTAIVRSKRFPSEELAIGLTLLNALGGRGTEIFLPVADASRLARAILEAAGEKTQLPLPQSRQIGGIIGPY